MRMPLRALDDATAHVYKISNETNENYHFDEIYIYITGARISAKVYHRIFFLYNRVCSTCS